MSIGYEYPARLATAGGARKEIHRLSLSLATAVRRRDHRSVGYLAGRLHRARSAAAGVLERQRQVEAQTFGGRMW